MENAYIFDSYKKKYGQDWNAVQKLIVNYITSSMNNFIAKRKISQNQPQQQVQQPQQPTEPKSSLNVNETNDSSSSYSADSLPESQIARIKFENVLDILQEYQASPSSIRSSDIYLATKAYLYSLYKDKIVDGVNLKGVRLDGLAASVASKVAATPEGQKVMNLQSGTQETQVQQTEPSTEQNNSQENPQQEPQPEQPNENSQPENTNQEQQNQEPQKKTEEETPGDPLKNRGEFTPEEIKNVSGVLYNFTTKNMKSFEKAVNKIKGINGSLRSVKISLGKLLKESKSLIKNGRLDEALVKKELAELPIEITFKVSLGDPNTSTVFKAEKASRRAEREKNREQEDLVLEHVYDFLDSLKEAEGEEPTPEVMTSVLKNLQSLFVKNLGTQTLKLGDAQYDVAFTAGDICKATDGKNGEFSIKIQKTAQYVEGASSQTGQPAASSSTQQNSKQTQVQNTQARKPTRWEKKQANRDYKIQKMYAQAAKTSARKGNATPKRTFSTSHKPIPRSF